MLGWHWTGRDVRLALDVEMRKGSRTAGQVGPELRLGCKSRRAGTGWVLRASSPHTRSSSQRYLSHHSRSYSLHSVLFSHSGSSSQHSRSSSQHTPLPSTHDPLPTLTSSQHSRPSSHHTLLPTTLFFPAHPISQQSRSSSQHSQSSSQHTPLPNTHLFPTLSILFPTLTSSQHSRSSSQHSPLPNTHLFPTLSIFFPALSILFPALSTLFPPHSSCRHSGPVGCTWPKAKGVICRLINSGGLARDGLIDLAPCKLCAGPPLWLTAPCARPSLTKRFSLGLFFFFFLSFLFPFFFFFFSQGGGGGGGFLFVFFGLTVVFSWLPNGAFFSSFYTRNGICVCVCVCVCVRRLAEWKERLCVDVISDCRQRCRLQAVWTRRVAAVSRWPSPRPLVHRHSHPASLQSASSRSRRFTQHPTNHRIVHTTPTPPPPTHPTSCPSSQSQGGGFSVCYLRGVGSNPISNSDFTPTPHPPAPQPPSLSP